MTFISFYLFSISAVYLIFFLIMFYALCLRRKESYDGSLGSNPITNMSFLNPTLTFAYFLLLYLFFFLYFIVVFISLPVYNMIHFID